MLVHVGFALGKVDEAEAERTYKLLEEMDQLQELNIPGVEEPTAVAQGQFVMKYLDEYRDETLAQKIVGEIRRTGDETVGVDGSLRRADAYHRQIRHRPTATVLRSNSCMGPAVRYA